MGHHRFTSKRYHFMTEKQVSEMTGRSRSSLRKDRFYRRGIPFVKIGGAVRYRLDAVQRYLRRSRIDPERPRLVG